MRNFVNAFLISLCVYASANAQQPRGDFQANARKSAGEIAANTKISAEKRLKLRAKYKIQKHRAVVSAENSVPGLIVIKFVDGSRVRSGNPTKLDLMATDQRTINERLKSLKVAGSRLDKADIAYLLEHGIKEADIKPQMQEVRHVLRSEDIVGWGRMNTQSVNVLNGLRARSELRTGRRASDLANYYWIQLGTNTDTRAVLKHLNNIKIIEQAYRMPLSRKPDIAPVTADYTNYQGYLDNDGNGIHARAGWNTPGAKGRLVRIIDIEGDWNLTHEDLPDINPLPRFDHFDASPDSDGNYDDHGTAVLGIMVAKDDGAGMTGIVPEANVGVVTHLRRTGFGTIVNHSDAILEATLELSAGDVLLLESHVGGPGNPDCTCEESEGKPRGQCGLLPVEWANHVYDAIQTASDSGIIVVEPAGNGEQDLDDPRFGGYFNRDQRDSGAIMVAASHSRSRTRECFSNHGDRIDLHGWGEKVATTGYGDGKPDCDGDPGCLGENEALVNGRGDPDQWYTGSFGGTSSASPIVAGAVVAIQGVQLTSDNPPLNWLEMRTLLKDTGTDPESGHNIGQLPNIEAAIASLAPPPPTTESFYEIELGSIDFADNTAGLPADSSSRRRELGSDNRFQGIERIKFAERGDKPCFLQVEQANVNNNALGERRSIDECGSSGHTDRSVRHVPLLTSAHNRYIRKIAVCNSKTRNRPARLKGIRLWESTIAADERGRAIVTPRTSETTEERSNCDDNWRSTSECPVGSIAGKIEVHLREDGDDLSVSGLRLMCRQVVNRCVSDC